MAVPCSVRFHCVSPNHLGELPYQGILLVQQWGVPGLGWEFCPSH